MSILAHPASIGQFCAMPHFPGILIPDPSAPYTKHYQVTPGVTDDVYVLGNTNRQIKREAGRRKFDHVPMNNQDITLLRDPSNPGKDVEVAFHYTIAGGLPYVHSDLGEDVDLRSQSFAARTCISYSVQQDRQTVNSQASKTVAAAQHVSLSTQKLLADKLIGLHLTGPTLNKFWVSRDFLRQYNPRDTASLAIAFSAYVFYEAGFHNSLQDGLFIMDEKMKAHPFFMENSDSSGLDGINFDELKATIDGMTHPKRGVIITSNLPSAGNSFYYDGNDPVKLEMSFKAPNFIYGSTKGETHIDLRIAAIGDEHDVTLNDDLLLGIWRHIVDNVPA